MSTEFRFVVEFTGKLDDVPGTFHSEADFHWLVMREFMKTSYAKSATVLRTTDTRDVFGGYGNMTDGWVEYPGDVDHLLPTDLVQLKLVGSTEGLHEWMPVKQPDMEWDNDKRPTLAAITHYRVKQNLKTFNLANFKKDKVEGLKAQADNLGFKLRLPDHFKMTDRGKHTLFERQRFTVDGDGIVYRNLLNHDEKATIYFSKEDEDGV